MKARVFALEQAAECLQKAAHATSPAAREEWLRDSEDWRTAAEALANPTILVFQVLRTVPIATRGQYLLKKGPL